jgi:hypothetical protein
MNAGEIAESKPGSTGKRARHAPNAISAAGADVADSPNKMGGAKILRFFSNPVLTV